MQNRGHMQRWAGHRKKWFDRCKVRTDEGRACDSTDYCTEFDCAIVDNVD